ncbi:nitrous oxide-stimulated promoter family protein [Desulfoscipio gibsoniae]|uniref:Nitrous oxide-stimulated promoter n=1 Tax=Desulfoscipio gibsoniae DSM 7213 TaxID=767817 RepID=R4KD12_9FIRM|nr:nitrous oxide-stimulated promoter family protein [Desulfoscipio gibsoniae]AGL00484.1 Nitrous oxide-stimulated promoter [Desulfoscipio gibsoniae DSM 7213]
MKKQVIEAEKDTICKMIKLYCRKKHGARQDLCHDCRELLVYASKRLDNCRFGNDKPTCEKCPLHCYKPEMRGKIKKVMRFSGPRMLYIHPLDAIRHMLKNRSS